MRFDFEPRKNIGVTFARYPIIRSRYADRCFAFGIIGPILLRLVPEDVVRASAIVFMHAHILRIQQAQIFAC